MNEKLGKLAVESTCCPMCEQCAVTVQTELEKFEYGTGQEVALLSVYIPVHKCSNCGYEFVGEKADELRHDAICDHLRLLRPGRIQEIRMRLSGSQKSFAALTHLGQASIQRWEQRQVLQSESNDLYLRLLEFPENIERLERFNRCEDMESGKGLGAFKGCGLGDKEVAAIEPVGKLFSLKKRVG